MRLPMDSKLRTRLRTWTSSQGHLCVVDIDSKQAKAAANKLKAEEKYQKAMEREGQEELAKKKRRGGNDSI